MNLVSDIKNPKPHSSLILFVFLNIDKDFDNVCVLMFLERLADLGLRGRITQYWKNYLSHRRSTVKLGNTFGFPQALLQALP